MMKKENKKQLVITDFICMDQSRLSRNDESVESLLMARKIRGYGVHINYIMYPIDTESSVSRLQEEMLYSFAAFERRNITAKALN
ncbi:MAG: recombinase family protein [bacterium]